MNAIVFDAFGGPDVLQLRQVDPPTPGPGEVLVRVHATSVNPVDTKIRREGGRYGLAPPIIVGYDVSGVVEAVGDGVGDLTVGDAVFYTPPLSTRGAYAEYHVVEAALAVAKPDALSHAEAAAGVLGRMYQQNGTVHFVMMERDGAMLDRIARLVERGRLRPLVADVLPLAEAAEAHRRIERGGVHGKLVLTPGV